jgi:hypothetical protein
VNPLHLGYGRAKEHQGDQREHGRLDSAHSE